MDPRDLVDGTEREAREVKRVGQGMVECNMHCIFNEYGGRVKKGMSVSDAAEFIVDQKLDLPYRDPHDPSELLEMDWENDDPHLDFIIYCRLYRQGRVNPRQVVKRWNIAMQDNGETHGTIFTGLFKGGEYELLNELMDDINNFDFDT